MSETIIIESNRQIAYDQEQSSNQKLAQINQVNYDTPNWKWRTHIDSGIQADVGDQISVEACMIQQAGSPEDTIEFSGANNIKNAWGSVDNEAKMIFSFYITNRQQFNCPLPLYGAEVKNSKADSQTLNYGLPDVSTFDKFKASYPYRGIEGMWINNGTPTEVDGGGVFSRPPAPIDDTSPIRFYWMNNDSVFKGYQTADGGIGELPEVYTSEVNIKIPEGFNTPDNVSAIITEAFHARNSNNQGGWEEESFQGKIFTLNGTSIVTSDNALITDNCYKSIPTSTGDILQGRLDATWFASIEGEANPAGTNYQEEQGLYMLYRNMLCATPETWTGSMMCLSLRQGHVNANNINPNNYDNAGTYTGSTNITNDIGQLGTFPCVFDIYDKQTSNVTWQYYTDRTTEADVVDIVCMTANENQVLATNIIYNNQNVEKLARMFLITEKPAPGINPKTADNQTNNYQYWNTQLQFGRTDDFQSCGATGAKIMLPTVNNYLGNPPIGGAVNSYQPINGTDTYVGFNEAFYDSAHKIWVKTRWKDTLDQSNPSNPRLTLPTNTLFSFTDSNDRYGDYNISKGAGQYGVAIVPVFLKAPPTANVANVPFCAFINTYSFDTIGAGGKERLIIPYPTVGEFFGISPSMYDNLLSKCVTTQKVVPINDTLYPDHTEPNTRPYSYMPYCMIGADNPTVSFTDSRIQLSGLHTAVRSGNGVFQILPQKANDESAIESMCVRSTDSAICGTDGLNNKIVFSSIIQTVEPYPVISSQSGISIESIQIPDSSGGYGNDLDPMIPSLFTGTLFDKLGFIAEQFIPFYGGRQIQFNRGNINNYLGQDVDLYDKGLNLVKPVTTNAYISGADQLSIVKNAAQQQMENLGCTATNFGTYVNAESDAIIAVNLPSKLDYPYLVVYSDIVRNTQFYGGSSGNQKIPAMAYISRNYSTGDYFYSFNTSWQYTIDNPYIITDFTTQIMLPDGRPAPIEKNSSIIYKIIKQKTLPPQLTIPANDESNKDEEKDKK